MQLENIIFACEFIVLFIIIIMRKYWFDWTGNKTPNLPHTKPGLYLSSHYTGSIYFYIWIYTGQLSPRDVQLSISKCCQCYRTH